MKLEVTKQKHDLIQKETEEYQRRLKESTLKDTEDKQKKYEELQKLKIEELRRREE